MNNLDILFETISDSDDVEFIESCVDAFLEAPALRTLGYSNDSGIQATFTKKIKEKYDEIKTDYKDYIKEAKACLKEKKFNDARQNIKKAGNKIDDAVKLIKSIEPTALDTAMSWIVSGTKEFVTSLTVFTIIDSIGAVSGADIDTNDTLKSNMGLAGIEVIFKFINNAYKICQAYEPGTDPAKALNPARANIIVSLNQCKKQLEKISKKIDKAEDKFKKKEGKALKEATEDTDKYDAITDVICEKFETDQIDADQAVALLEKAAEKYL